MSVPLTRDQVTALWFAEALNLSDKQAGCLPQLIAWMDARRYCHYSCALRGREPKRSQAAFVGAPASPQELARSFREAILSHADFEGQSKDMLNIVAKVADRANALGFLEICPPPIAVSLSPEPSPYAPDNWPRTGMASRVRDALANAVTERTQGTDPLPAVALGQCLISAVVHGGLLCVEALEALVQRLIEPGCPLETFGRRMSIDLVLGYQGQPAVELRRWFPDALSAILLQRLSSAAVVGALGLATDGVFTGTPQRKSLWRVIEVGFASLALPIGDAPRSLSAFLEDVQLDMLMRLPPLLVNYGSRRIISHSLKRHVWARLHGVSVACDEASAGLVEDPDGVGNDDDLSPSGDPEPRWMGGLRAAVKPDDPKQMESLLQALLDRVGHSAGEEGNGGLFAQFALYLLRYRLRSGRRLRPRTIRAYVMTMARRIGGLLGQESAWGQDPVLWARLYEQALDETTSSASSYKLARQLRSFHRFLAEFLGLDPQAGRSVLGAAGGLIPVEANLLSPEEFRASLAQVEEAVRRLERPDEGMERIARLVLILGFRCGLRPSEARLLAIADVCPHPPAELLIRESALRTLKTPNATRKIPLAALLEPAELAELLRWTARRQASECAVPYSPYLFSLPERDFQVVPEETLLPIIHRALRKATGDPSAHYYNLRHAFATWTTLKLVKAGQQSYAAPGDSPALRPYGQKASDPDPLAEVLGDAVSFHRRLYDHCTVSRKHAFAVASLLGHSEPAMSCEHYVHCLDLLWADALANDGCAPLRKTVVALSKDSLTTAYRLTSGPDPMQVALREAKGTAVLDADPGAPTSVPHDEVEDREASARLVRLWRILLLYSTRRTSLTSLAQFGRQNVPTLQRWIRRAQFLEQMRSGRGVKGFRHRFMEWQADRRVAERVRTLCPIKPREAREVAILNELTPRIRQALVQDQVLCRKALGYFVRKMWQNGTTLVFHDPTDPAAALTHLAFLRLVGFQLDHIRFIAFDLSARSRPLAQWKQALGLRRRVQFARQAPTNRAYGKGCRWLGIRPVFDTDFVGDGNKKAVVHGKPNDEAQDRSVGAGAFRYLMLMAAILMGWEGEDDDLQGIN